MAQNPFKNTKEVYYMAGKTHKVWTLPESDSDNITSIWRGCTSRRDLVRLAWETRKLRRKKQ